MYPQSSYESNFLVRFYGQQYLNTYISFARFEEAATNFLELLVNIVEVRTSNFVRMS